MFTAWILLNILLYAPPNFAQRYDFKGLTPNDYMNMDLGSIFGLFSRFGAVWGGITVLRSGSLALAENLGLSKSKWGPRLLEPCGRRRSGFAGQGHSRIGRVATSVRVVTVQCDEELGCR